MLDRQRGITFIGWLVLLLPLAIVGYAGIRLAPVYLNYFKVARTLEQTAVAFRDEEAVTAQQIRMSLDKRLDIEMVEYPTSKEIGIRRDGQVWVMEAAYEDVAPLFANVSLVVSFDRRVELH